MFIRDCILFSRLFFNSYWFSLFAKSSIPLPLRKSILCFKFIVIMIVAKPGVLFCLFLWSYGKREIIVILVGLSSIGIQLNLMLLRTWFRQPTLSIFFILRLYFHFLSIRFYAVGQLYTSCVLFLILSSIKFIFNWKRSRKKELTLWVFLEISQVYFESNSWSKLCY